MYANTNPGSKMRALMIEKYGFKADEEILFGREFVHGPICKEFFAELGKTYKKDGDELRKRYYNPERVGKIRGLQS